MSQGLNLNRTPDLDNPDDFSVPLNDEETGNHNQETKSCADTDEEINYEFGQFGQPSPPSLTPPEVGSSREGSPGGSSREDSTARMMVPGEDNINI